MFQGVEGAYSYAAMRAYFDSEIESCHVRTWRDAMEMVSEGQADYAVLPIENSTAGIVADIYDLLTEYRLYIVGEQIIPVEHVLLGASGDRAVRDQNSLFPSAGAGAVQAFSGGTSGLERCGGSQYGHGTAR